MIKEHARIISPEEMIQNNFNPNMCEVGCLPDSQTTYWRAFTEPSLNAFMERGYTSTVDFEHATAGYVDNLYPWTTTESLEKNGALWTSPDLSFAFSMGLMRAVTEDIPVSLLGVNYCRHDEQDGVKGYKVVGLDRNTRILLPLSHDTVSDQKGITHGTLFNKFTDKQIRGAVAYSIPQPFVDQLRTFTDFKVSPDGKEARSLSDSYWNLFGVLSSELFVSEFPYSPIPKVAEPHLAFLQPTKIPGLPTRSVSTSLYSPNANEAKFLQDIFVNRAAALKRKERLQPFFSK